MAGAEMNALVTHGESSMAVIIDDVIEDKTWDEIEIHEAIESSHEATETNHEAIVETEDELWSVNKGEENWWYMDIYLKSTAVKIKGGMAYVWGKGFLS